MTAFTNPRTSFVSAALALACLVMSVPAPATTWGDLKILGLNANPQDDFNKTWIYRNLALQGRAWCPLSDMFCMSTPPGSVSFKGAGDPNEGYPIGGSKVNLVIASQLTSDNQGDYEISVAGNNPMQNTGWGTLSTPIYDSVTNRTTATLHIDPGSDQNISLLWSGPLLPNGVTADFGDLKVMQPTYHASGTQRFTSAAVTHYSRTPVIRGMDRLRINNNPDVNWSGSLAADKNTLLGYQHSLKGVFDLTAKVGASTWVNIPHGASDSYISSFMAAVANYLKPNTVAIVEYGNEPWNWNFSHYYAIFDQAFVAANTATGYANGTKANKVLSIVRDATSGTVTITLSKSHNKAPGDQVYVAADTTGAIPGGLVTLATGTMGKTLKYIENCAPSCTNAQGVVDTGWYNSFVHLSPTNALAAPMTTFGKAGVYANAYAVKTRYEMTRLRTIYNAVPASIADRVRIVKGVQLAMPEYDLYGLAWAKEYYGSLSWLDLNGGGLTAAYYLRPLDGHEGNMTTPDLVFYELELVRPLIAANLIKLKNVSLSLGQNKLTGYEGGPHNDLKPTQEVADAVQIAHRDDLRMPVLLANTWADWRNRGGDLLMYFHAGATSSFGGIETGDGQNNNTWSLIEGTLISSGNRVKDDFFTAQQMADADPVGVDGVTKGNIVLKDVWSSLYDLGAREYAGQLFVAPDINETTYRFMVTADSTKSYSVALDAGSTATGADHVTLYLDGVPMTGNQTLPYCEVYAGPCTAQAASFSASIPAGVHTIEARLDTTRAGAVGLYRLRVN